MKAKVVLTTILIMGMLILVSLLAFFLVVIIVNDFTKWQTGIISVLSFFITACVFGLCLEKVISLIKMLWEENKV